MQHINKGNNYVLLVFYYLYWSSWWTFDKKNYSNVWSVSRLSWPQTDGSTLRYMNVSQNSCHCITALSETHEMEAYFYLLWECSSCVACLAVHFSLPIPTPSAYSSSLSLINKPSLNFHKTNLEVVHDSSIILVWLLMTWKTQRYWQLT